MKLVATTTLLICLGSALPAEPNDAASAPQPITITHELPLFFTLNYQGNEYGMAWGLNPLVADQLKTVSGAKPHVEAYQMTNLLGNVTFWGGLYAFAWGAASAVAVWDHTDHEGGARVVSGIGVGMLVAGFWSMVASVPLTAISWSELHSGVVAYAQRGAP
jgi:hypothetical protein